MLTPPCVIKEKDKQKDKEKDKDNNKDSAHSRCVPGDPGAKSSPATIRGLALHKVLS